jgi:diguanylate cyclase (GGDEF)-like protein
LKKAPRGSYFRLPIGAWLVLGFGLVIGAFAYNGISALRSTRDATAQVTRVQKEFEPLTRQARELGDRASAFDRAVLASLRMPSDENREAVLTATQRLAQTMNQVSGTPLLLERMAEHQRNGFQLLALKQQQRRAVAGMQQAYADLDRHVTGAGGRGVVVGSNVLTRPSLAELTDALEAARNDSAASLGSGSAAQRATLGERRFARALEDHAQELARSPGKVWLELVQQDFSLATSQRRRGLELDAQVEAARLDFTANGDALAVEIRDKLEAPAWSELTVAANAARASVRRAERTIGSATVKSIMIALIALAIITLTITWPVRRLTAGTRKLAAGELDTRVRRGGARELDELAQTFNVLADELNVAERSVRSYQAQLEKRVEERTLQLRHLAEHDPLTNLPNRRQLFQRLTEMIDGASPTRDHIAVVFLDLDNFKTVNDSLGHEFGDRVLAEIGERLRALSGEAGFIARLGGDEFTLVYPFNGSVDEIERRTETLVSSFQRPIVVDGREIAIGVSCGAAIFPEHGRDATGLLRAADAALFRAKELGRNQLCVYDPALLVQASNRFRVEQALRRAIEGGDFVLYFQPQVCLTRKRTTAVEALLRWRRSDGQIVAAGDFIGIAEQSGLLLDLSEWVLEEAARKVSEWRRQGWEDARIAINVSAQQFLAGDFLGELERVLHRHELPADAIELELTENTLQTGAVTLETLRSLRQMGVTTALDDFGTGYSSLTSLEQLPLSRVKLDRSVVAEVDWNPRSAAIARSIIGLCHSLGLQVTVEGVERPSQLDFLVGLGDVDIQGYLVAPPAEAGELLDFVSCTPARMDTLLEAAERAEPAPLDPDGGIVRLRRRNH